MPRVILNGEPGEVWSNDSNKLLYQLIVSFSNSCGLCCQYHHAIGSYWPIPFHRGCNCRQVPIEPGASARPFADFREEIGKLDRVQQSRVVGRANLTLIDKGIVSWEDVVTKARVRDLNEVVSLKKLKVAEMVDAGVTPHIAERAYASVHTPAHELADRQRRRLVESIVSQGVSRQQLRESFGKGIAARVNITGGGSTGTQTLSLPPTPIEPSPAPAVIPLLPAVAKTLRIKPGVVARIKALFFPQGDS